MSDYEVDIRDFRAEYDHLIARQANREVDDGYEISLSRIVVTVKLTTKRSREWVDNYFEVAFRPDHEQHAIEFVTVGDAHDNKTSYRPEEIMLATEVGSKAVSAWLEDVDVPYAAPEHAITVPQADSDPVVHTDLTVMPDE